MEDLTIMKKLLFIYNPISGKEALKGKLYTIVDRFTKEGWLVTAYPTQCKGDATRAARELGAGYDRVVCSGGDGTLSETVAGLMDLTEPPVLGYIPAGSTNDCAGNLRLPLKLELSAAIAAGAGEPLPLDVGRLNGKTFIYVAAFGAFTEVAYDTPQELKKAFGHLAYILAGIGQLNNLAPYHLKVEYGDNVIEDDFLYGMVCNTYSVGGMKALPGNRVVLDDGLFEVVLVRNPVNLAELMSVLQSLLLQSTTQDGPVVSFQADHVTLSCDRGVPWTVDGEYGGTFEVSQVDNCRRALTLVHGKNEAAEKAADRSKE